MSQTTENNTVADRIRVRMAEKNLKQIQVAESIGSSKGTVSKWLSGKNTPKNDYLIRLARLLGTSPEWIISGDNEKDYASNERDLSGDDRQYLVGKLGLDSSTNYDTSLLIEMNGGTIDYEAKELEVELDSQVAAFELARRTGIFAHKNDSDAMLPKLYSNAEYMVNADQKEVRDGKMYLYRHGMTTKVRYLHKRPDGGYLVRCDNNSYDDEVITANDLKDFKVIGWVYRWTNEDLW